MVQYGEAARQFAIKVYDSAIKLSNYISKYVKYDANVGTDKMTQDEYKFYINSRILEILGDYTSLTMDNSKATANIIDSTWFGFYQYTISNDIKAQTATQSLKIFSALSGERVLMEKALDNFSYYEYTVGRYNGDINAYLKDDASAKHYLTQIEKYFINENNYLALTYDYLTQNVFTA